MTSDADRRSPADDAAGEAEEEGGSSDRGTEGSTQRSDEERADEAVAETFPASDPPAAGPGDEPGRGVR